MTNAIASTLPDPSSYVAIGWILVGIVAILTGLNQGMRFMSHFRERPIPADTYVTKVHCDATHAGLSHRLGQTECAVVSIREQISTAMTQLDEKDEARAVALHSRINGVEALVNQILGQLKAPKK